MPRAPKARVASTKTGLGISTLSPSDGMWPGTAKLADGSRALQHVAAVPNPSQHFLRCCGPGARDS